MYIRKDEEFNLDILKKDFDNLMKENGLNEEIRKTLFEIVKKYDENETMLVLTSYFNYCQTDIFKEDIKQFIKNPDILLNVYTVYWGYKTKGEWAEAFKYEYEFLDIFSLEDLVEFYFKENSKDEFIAYLKNSIDLGKFEKQIDNIEIIDILNKLIELDLTDDFDDLISPFIDWESLIDKIINGNFIVSSWYEDIIIVESY
ncbi:hypothetical protein B0F89_14315 [Malaciobacter marinus]|jgi:hypothetical protein|uniref:DUF4375 domain-containing protein n=1 Tax=Malaciobacter marinus TaxID=505249 RepID=A0AB36ZUT4_9BACT|nr:hypothetical protein [Malaciobacter marinus]PPK57890.1 hypothetical protein B0F89_14315 [Malaciobacter marinus]